MPKTKICGKCKKEKNIREEFGIKASGAIQSYCRSCQNANTKKWYQNNKESHKKNTYKRNQEKRRELRIFVIEYLRNHPCKDCGEDDIIVLQFHHRRSSRKINSIATLITNATSLRVLKEEIKKCDVLCANCHTRRIAKKNKWLKVLG